MVKAVDRNLGSARAGSNPVAVDFVYIKKIDLYQFFVYSIVETSYTL